MYQRQKQVWSGENPSLQDKLCAPDIRVREVGLPKPFSIHKILNEFQGLFYIVILLEILRANKKGNMVEQ